MPGAQIMMWNGVIKMASKKLQKYRSIVAGLGCVICREFLNEHTEPCLHHIAQGSGLRSEYFICGLCPEHHTGASGFHSSPRNFLRLYKLPTEYHLLELVNKFRAEDNI